MRIKSIGKIAGLLVAAAMVVSAVSANAAMEIYTGITPLQNNAGDPVTKGVVGTIEGTTGAGQGGWDAGTFQKDAAQALLNLGLGGVGSSGGEAIHANTVYDYSGTVNYLGSFLSKSKDDAGFNTTVPAGWEFVIAKYDGQNAGYVLFYLGGNSATLPVAPANYWTTQSGQYGISGWAAFNAVPEPTTMVAGALLLLPFGASTIRFLRKNRTV